MKPTHYKHIKFTSFGRPTLLLEDLLQEDVMLADSLDDQSLSIEHGAPMRLIAPKHYGYKNLKHLMRIEFYSTMPVVKHGISAFLDHPRARTKRRTGKMGSWLDFTLCIPATYPWHSKRISKSYGET